MALNSPGVEVTIIDESQYLPAAPASVPLIVVATAQNKVNASGTGIAVGTTAANANKLYAVTSQRDLVTLFGNPFFYKTTNGTPIQGYELNEYGLLAAYSALGSTNLAYVVRANIDLASLVGKTGRPTGNPTNGTFWLDTSKSTWGIYQFNQVSGQFTVQAPLVITDSTELVAGTSGMPLSSIGNLGDYAVTFVTDSSGGTTNTLAPNTYATYWYKTNSNIWTAVGSSDWKSSWPVVTSNPSPVVIIGQSMIINSVQVTATASSVNQFATDINAANIPFITAAVVNGKLEIYCSGDMGALIGAGTPSSILPSLGIQAGTYNSPAFEYGTNAQQPQWRSQNGSLTRPTGSVWVKTNAANLGTSVVVSQYSSSTDLFVNKNVQLATSDWSITNTLDAAGGLNIPSNSVYAQYNFDESALTAPLQLFSRSTTGPAVFTGTTINPTFTIGSSFKVSVSAPGYNTLNPYTGGTPYTVTITGTTAASFVTAWAAAGIPNTTAQVSATGAIVLTHAAGGVIILDDSLLSGDANSPVTKAGFVINSTVGAKWGPYKTFVYSSVATTGGTGTTATVNISNTGPNVTVTIANPGTAYTIGDIIGASTTSPQTISYSIKVTNVGAGGEITGISVISPTSVTPVFTVQMSNWVPMTYIPSYTSPTQNPANNTNWFYSVVNQVDIMTNVNGSWTGYKNVAYAENGLPKSSGLNTTDANGPIISATAPTKQSDGISPLAYGDLWIDSNDLENYPVISRWQDVGGVSQWVLIDNADQLTETGILFADARWAPNGTTDPVVDAIPTIKSLLTSNYLDIDAPSAQNYPQGTLLFNTRRSGYNVKQFRANYFSGTNFPDADLPVVTSAWVTVSGNMSNGAPYMGRKAQRAMVVAAMKTTVDTSSQIRESETFFNLMATPNYCELQPNMVALNNDRGQTAYIIGDTPLRLAANANDIIAWATNTAGATSTGEQGLVTRNTYMGLYYPSGITTDLQGSEVVVPPSHMMLRTIIYNDTVAYPWFAPAGQRRGVVDNATNIGYIDGNSGEFVTNKNGVQLRDIEYGNYINPIAYFTNLGLLNYGNKNSFASDSALDRTNVARLICYLRWNLQRAVRPFLFEPNDSLTRTQARGVVQTLLADIQTKRGLYDYLVVCDDSNNTPARIDRNELWIDVAIEPVKAVEFIYIPVRILNTGEIAGLGQNG